MVADQAPRRGADARRNPESTQTESVKTGRTIAEIADEDA
jgi:hypothetical protein